MSRAPKQEMVRELAQCVRQDPDKGPEVLMKMTNRAIDRWNGKAGKDKNASIRTFLEVDGRLAQRQL